MERITFNFYIQPLKLGGQFVKLPKPMEIGIAVCEAMPVGNNGNAVPDGRQFSGEPRVHNARVLRLRDTKPRKLST